MLHSRRSRIAAFVIGLSLLAPSIGSPVAVHADGSTPSTTVATVTPPVAKPGAPTSIEVSVDPAPTEAVVVHVVVYRPDPLGNWNQDVALDVSGMGSAAIDTTDMPDGTYPVDAFFDGTVDLAASIGTSALTIDSVPPPAVAATVQLLAGTSSMRGHVRTTIGFTSGGDLATVEFRQQIDGGVWKALATVHNGSTLGWTLSTGHRYRFQTRATDIAGNIGGWATSGEFLATSISQASSKVTHSASWSTAHSSVYWGGSALTSSKTSATATLRATASSLAWISRVGPTRGKAKVYLDGVYVATIDLHAAKAAGPRIVWAVNTHSHRPHTVKIKVSGTTGHPSVVVDGFIVSG